MLVLLSKKVMDLLDVGWRKVTFNSTKAIKSSHRDFRSYHPSERLFVACYMHCWLPVVREGDLAWENSSLAY